MSEDTDMAILNAADKIVAAISDASTDADSQSLHEVLRTCLWDLSHLDEDGNPTNATEALMEVAAAIRAQTEMQAEWFDRICGKLGTIAGNMVP